MLGEGWLTYRGVNSSPFCRYCPKEANEERRYKQKLLKRTDDVSTYDGVGRVGGWGVLTPMHLSARTFLHVPVSIHILHTCPTLIYKMKRKKGKARARG